MMALARTAMMCHQCVKTRDYHIMLSSSISSSSRSLLAVCQLRWYRANVRRALSAPRVCLAAVQAKKDDT